MNPMVRTNSEVKEKKQKYKHNLLIFNSTLIDAKKLRKKEREERS